MKHWSHGLLAITIGCFVLANCACGKRESGVELRDEKVELRDEKVELRDEKVETAQPGAGRPGNAKGSYIEPSDSSCDMKGCPLGCCNEGECNAYIQQTKLSCGMGGEPCAQCPRDALSCTVGHCVVDESCLDYCNDGCCTEQGMCMPFGEQSPGACGAASVCVPCGTKQQCAQGECTPEPVWLILIRSVKISDKKADGQHWDTMQAGARLPDPYIQSGLNSGSVTFPEGETHRVDDTLMPRWSPQLQSSYFHTERSLLKNGLRFRIHDSDTGIDESISECAISVSLADLALGSKMISTCGMSGLAMDLRVDFRSQR